MQLTVWSVTYPLVRVSADTAGGAEQIVAALDDGLTSRGHGSLVVAAKGSRARGTLIATPDWNGAIDGSVRACGTPVIAFPCGWCRK